MYAVIMAGGRGARFWPRSREKKPKHLLDIVSDRTIIRETVDRILPMIPPENVLVVTGESHAEELIRQLPEIPKENILIEPVGRNTAPCIGLAALHIRRKTPDAVMLVLPSDHLIRDEKRFRKVLNAAATVARRADFLVTVGIRPTHPAGPGRKPATATSNRGANRTPSTARRSMRCAPCARSRIWPRRRRCWRRAVSPGTAACSSGGFPQS